jgi:hypothetical protein
VHAKNCSPQRGHTRRDAWARTSGEKTDFFWSATCPLHPGIGQACGASPQFNELASLGRYKLFFGAQKRAVALVKTQALTLAGIIAALKEEKLVPKSETNGRYALTDTLKRAGLSAQREAACPWDEDQHARPI